jgi:hypothetical protein
MKGDDPNGEPPRTSSQALSADEVPGWIEEIMRTLNGVAAQEKWNFWTR